MTEATAAPGSVPTQTPYRETQRLAWAVVAGSFLTFSTLCIVLGFGVNFFLFRSTVPVQSTLRVGRGSAGIMELGQPEQVERERRGLLTNQVVRTDPQSQATISFRDTRNDESLITTITLKGSTSLMIRNASRPRFEWGSAPYDIELSNFTGEIEIFVSGELDRELRLDIQAPHGARIDISSGGQYFVNASDTRVRVVNRGGMALLIPPAPRTNPARVIPANEQAVMQLHEDGTAAIQLTDAFIDLVENSTFQQTHIPEARGEDETLQELPLGWRCANGPNNLPRGSYSVEELGGRSALRLFRGEGADTHGETFCTQVFGPDARVGLDVTAFDELALRASLYISDHSLNTCGVAGSECPLMLRIDYVDTAGEFRTWFHGFYSKRDQQLDYPLRCSSCTQDHEVVNQQAWYTYDSGNIFTQFPQEQRPASILNVRFYASGHQYEVYVSEVSLLARQSSAGAEEASAPPSAEN